MSDYLKNTIQGLKPFQRATVNHCVERFNNGQNKVLVADEVGLGKTLIAKGVIANLYDQFRKEYPKKEYKVIYVCSNLEIARQNIKKLNVFANSSNTDGDNVVVSDSRQDRLTLMAYQIKRPDNKWNCTIQAITPGTSFSTRSIGKEEERLLLFWILRKYKAIDSYKIGKLLKGGQKSFEKWKVLLCAAECKTRDYQLFPKVDSVIVSNFKKKLKEPLNEEVITRLNKHFDNKFCEGESVLYVLMKILKLETFNARKLDNDGFYRPYNKLIRELRYLLAEACAENMKADLFILDEFQRFKKVLDYDENTEDEDAGLALGQKILRKEDSNVLMLSATPFKPYSTDYEELQGENHSVEFSRILDFLLDGDDLKVKTIEDLKKQFFKSLKFPKQLKSQWETHIKTKTELQAMYKNVMCRTERSIAIKEAKELLRKREINLEVHKQDIEDFVVFDKIVAEINEVDTGQNLAIPLEYSKSSPFALSFLQDYLHWKKLEKHYKYKENKTLRSLVKKSGNVWLSDTRINNYDTIIPTERSKDPPNAKLRLLQNEMKPGYDFLWIPPTLPYYSATSTYKVDGTNDYSKMLIFSKWRMVPRMISAVISYDADRLNMERLQKETKGAVTPYFKNTGKKRFPQSRIKAFQKQKGYTGKNEEMLSIPSLTLATLFDSQSNINYGKTILEIKNDLRSKFKVLFSQEAFNANQNDTGSNSQMWSWYSYLLVDDISNIGQEWIGLTGKNDVVKYTKARYATNAQWSLYKNDAFTLTSERYEQVIEGLAIHCLANPAICAYRSLKKLFNNENDDVLLLAAHIIGTGFLSFFDKPESMAIIDNSTKAENYPERILAYCLEGNLQAVLDEYFYMLRESSGFYSATELAKNVHDILTIQVGASHFNTLKTLETNKTHSIRTHFARNFSDKTAKANNNEVSLRDSFNSPFRPFVLASTSIGQEGLDFHYYSNKIMHWNLPSNPINFEQREGRINRYKSHVIRKNLAHFTKDFTPKSDINMWEQLFDEYENNNLNDATGLIPFWHFPDPLHKIERFIPLHAFSKDANDYKELLKVLTYYRLTFGQPGQKELIDILANAGLTVEQQNDLMINLSPIMDN